MVYTRKKCKNEDASVLERRVARRHLICSELGRVIIHNLTGLSYGFMVYHPYKAQKRSNYDAPPFLWGSIRPSEAGQKR